jgi:hypothetical protein
MGTRKETNLYKAPNEKGTYLLIEGSGTKVGEWWPVTAFDYFHFQMLTMSGTGAGTYSGLVDVETSLLSDDVAPPTKLFTFSSSGSRTVDYHRTNYIRGNCRQWNGSAGHVYKLLIAMWDSDGDL